MSTTVTYNGVTLENVLTKTFDQEAVYDESRTDKLYDRFRIVVVGYCHNWVPQSEGGGSTATTYIAPAGASATLQEVAIRKLLMEARKPFSMKIGTATLLSADGAANAADAKKFLTSASLDVNNGPRPLGCNVVHIVGSATLRIEFSIEVCKMECRYPTNTQGVLNNRWSMTDEYNEHWYCTRTIKGRLRVAHNDLNPQAFRGWVVPPLQPTFRRQRMSFVTSPNGLEMTYEITDRQVYAAAPFPAVDWDGVHTESTNDGVNSFSEIHLRLTGPPLANKKLLIQTAAIIAESRLQMETAAEGEYLLDQASIVDYLHTNSIEFRIRMQHVKAPSTYYSLIGETLGSPLSQIDVPDYNQFISRTPTTDQLTTVTGLFICYLQSPCNDTHRVVGATDAAPIEPSEGDSGGEEPTIETSTGEMPAAYEPDYSLKHREHIFTSYAISCTYEGSVGSRVQLPVAMFNPTINEREAVVVRLGGGTPRRVIEIEAERADDWPAIPPLSDYEDPTGPAALLSYKVSPEVRLAKDSSRRIFYIRAKYVFALQRRPQPGEMVAPKLPIMGDVNPSQAAGFRIDAETFDGGILVPEAPFVNPSEG